MKGWFGINCILLLSQVGWSDQNLLINGNELVNSGDRVNTGTIIFYPQEHRLFDGRFHEYVEDSEFCKEVAKSQFRILRQLKSWGCRVVFSEGHLSKMTLKNVNPTDLRTVTFYFDDGIPRRPTDLQKAILYEYGAAFVYLCLEENVTVYPTIDMEDHLFIDMVVQHNLSKGKELPDLAYEEREILALEEIQGYFKKHPGNKVALIYGFKHNFHRHLNPDFNPKFLVSN